MCPQLRLCEYPKQQAYLLHFDVCNSTDCQVYYGAGANSSSYQANDRTDQAVDETAGEYAWYNGQVIEALYSSSHGGASESVYNVWGSSLERYPYLCGVSDPYEADMASKNSYSSWTVSYSSSELAQRLQNYGYNNLQRGRLPDPHILRPGECDPGAE